MAHKKGQGSTKNGRDSNPQFRGIKLFGGEPAKSGSIIVRQVGTPFEAGFNVRRAKDDTLFSVAEGIVTFQGRVVHVLPTDAAAPCPVWLKGKVATAAN
ncbi:MAG: bL27 family ribosomal protein [Planctomycetota bacterium]|nr:bL27 family ribosomal protein [Planctomycetota bacterium]